VVLVILVFMGWWIFVD